MRHILKAAVLSVGLVAPIGAGASSLVDLVANSGISPDDFAMMETEARQLYQPVQVVGTKRDWANTGTGAEGSVTLRQVSGGCVELYHLWRGKGAPRDIAYRVWRCRAPDGRWLLSVRPN